MVCDPAGLVVAEGFSFAEVVSGVAVSFSFVEVVSADESLSEEITIGLVGLTSINLLILTGRFLEP